MTKAGDFGKPYGILQKHAQNCDAVGLMLRETDKFNFIATPICNAQPASVF
jgi:hypothetical protein